MIRTPRQMTCPHCNADWSKTPCAVDKEKGYQICPNCERWFKYPLLTEETPVNDNLGWPYRYGVPLHPEKNDYHWLEHNSAVSPPSQPFIVYWSCEVQSWLLKNSTTCLGSLQPNAYRYLGPCTPPSKPEVTSKPARNCPTCGTDWTKNPPELYRESYSYHAYRRCPKCHNRMSRVTLDDTLKTEQCGELQPGEPFIPQGQMLVPEEPTEDMLSAANRILRVQGFYLDYTQLGKIYKAFHKDSIRAARRKKEQDTAGEEW